MFALIFMPFGSFMAGRKVPFCLCLSSVHVLLLHTNNTLKWPSALRRCPLPFEGPLPRGMGVSQDHKRIFMAERGVNPGQHPTPAPSPSSMVPPIYMA